VADNRRQHARADASTTARVLARHNPGATLTIECVSLGGARMVGELTVEIGERVQILFEVEGHPLDVTGEVVRAERVDMATDRVAIRFIGLANAHRDVIRRWVERLLALDDPS
jgi:hypothetical protein